MILIDLAEDGAGPRREFWDVDELPCLSPQPEHLQRAQLSIVTISTSYKGLVLLAEGIVVLTRDIEIWQRFLLPTAILQIN